MDNLLLITPEEQALRIGKLRSQMEAAGVDCALVSTNTNIYYLTGRIFSGYIYLPPEGGDPIYFIKRPVHLKGSLTVSITKPEQIPSELKVRGMAVPKRIGLELGSISYNMALRIAAAMGQNNDTAEICDISQCLSKARAAKTPYEIHLMRMSGAKHERVYRKIANLYQPGITDIELQIEIERLSRLEGCLGQFRVAGDDMEIYMGNVLAGDNADAPSPYDFAMGGAGAHPSLPVGANGTLLRPGMTVMVDMNGNYTGYMTDMTRTFAIGEIPPIAIESHKLSIEICKELAQMGIPGMEAKALYQHAEEMVKDAGFELYFMGHRQHAGFIGHGVGLEINELPVISPRSKHVLELGNTIALEPKFVIPGVGAVGIENTYVVGDGGMECITRATQDLIYFDR